VPQFVDVPIEANTATLRTSTASVNTSLALSLSSNNSFKSVEEVTRPQSQVQTLVRVSTKEMLRLLDKAVDFSNTQELRRLGFTVSQLKASQCFNLQELLGAGYLPQELKDVNVNGMVYTVKDLRMAG